jgi:plasmid stabilization system protein ParE
MSQAKWTLQAELELIEVAFYIASQDRRPATADNIVDEIREKCDRYAQQPLMGTAAPDQGEGVRMFPHKRWIIFYLPSDYGIDVLSIVDGARDYPNRFRDA